MPSKGRNPSKSSFELIIGKSCQQAEVGEQRNLYDKGTEI